MGWQTQEVALREMAKAERVRAFNAARRKHGNLTVIRLACSVPNRLAGVEINEDGDAI